MKTHGMAALTVVFFLFYAAAICTSALLKSAEGSGNDSAEQIKKSIERHLGRPYSVGQSGPKRFDCSGFVWRVMLESGIYVKRTSARKLFLILPKAREEECWQLGTVVFFNRLRHCGLVEDSSFFYHASRKLGSARSRFDPYWRSRVSGFRKMPRTSGERDAEI